MHRIKDVCLSNKIYIYILKETSNANTELVVLERTPRLCLRFVLFDMRHVNTFIIVMYGVMNYLLLRPNLAAFYETLNEHSKTEIPFALEASFRIYIELSKICNRVSI